MLTGGAEGFSTGAWGVPPGVEISEAIAQVGKTNLEELRLIRDGDGSEFKGVLPMSGVGLVALLP
jgi:hypothetical protein